MTKRPNLIKISGRTHYACTRCKISKIRCLGEKPACSNCKQVKKDDQCTYPPRDRKIVIMESDLNELYLQILLLEKQLEANSPAAASAADVEKKSLKLPSHITHNSPSPEGDFTNMFLRQLPQWCWDQVPDRTKAWELISLVTRTYSAEMFIVDYNHLQTRIDNIYAYFPNYQASRDDQDSRPCLIDLCYFFAILAFGQQIQNSDTVTSGNGDKAVPGLQFYSLACRLFHIDCEHVRFTYIQSSILLGLISCNLNRYNTTYNYFGVAVSSAVSNGYHRQITLPAFKDDESRSEFLVIAEKKKRLWWTIFFIDVIWAARMNMPAHMDFTDTDVPLPNEMPYDLHDQFDIASLDSNVQLIKYVAKFNKLIYGPSLRTFSVNYINTDKFNQDRLVQTIVTSIGEITTCFEEPFLVQTKSHSIITHQNRNLANIFSRFNQLIILVVEPLLSLVFNPISAALVEKNEDVFMAIVKGIRAAYTTVNMLYKLFEHGKLFLFGFWDSQHLFSAFTLLVLVLIAGFPYKDHNKVVALLKHMAQHKNISSKRFLERIESINDFIDAIPEVNLHFDMNAEISQFVTPRDSSDDSPEFYNPFSDENLFSEESKRFIELKPTELLYEHFKFNTFSEESQKTLWEVSKSIQKWSNYSGLPIPISGITRTMGVVKNGQTRVKTEFSINDLI